MRNVVMLVTLLPTVGGQIIATSGFFSEVGRLETIVHTVDQHRLTPAPYVNVGVILFFDASGKTHLPDAHQH